MLQIRDRDGSFTKEQTIIYKEKVADGRTTSADTYTV
jgi:hypothetical protein